MDGKHMEQSLLSPAGLAEYLDVPVATIYQWQHKGTGPTARRVGRHLRFLPQDVTDWLSSRDAATTK